MPADTCVLSDEVKSVLVEVVETSLTPAPSANRSSSPSSCWGQESPTATSTASGGEEANLRSDSSASSSPLVGGGEDAGEERGVGDREPAERDGEDAGEGEESAEMYLSS